MCYTQVAFGTDRRYQKTRDNIVPFTNVGVNKSAIFDHLDFLSATGVYYATVRASSVSYATAEVTSNGLRIGFFGGVAGIKNDILS